MITRERLHKFIRTRCHEIRHQVKEFCTTHDGEALHILRVEVKKLRAAAALLQKGSSSHHLPTKGLKEVFKAAGAIRTAQINLKIFSDLGLESEAFIQEQQRIIEEGSTAFCQAAHRYRHDVHRVQEDLEAATTAIKPQKVRSLFAERIQKLSLFFSAPALDTVALHNTRKETKELLYMYTLLPPALAASLPLNKDYLDGLQHRLGDWHDNAVTLSLLQGFGTTDPGLLQKLQVADTALLDEIKDLTTDFAQKISTVPEAGTAPVENTAVEPPVSTPAPQKDELQSHPTK